MDWSKAKTVLIISFLIMNIILGYIVIKQDKPDDNLVDDKLIEKSIDLLKEKNIEVKVDIPNEIVGLPALVVKYENLSSEELNKNFFNNEGQVKKEKSEEGQIEEVFTTNEKIRNINNKLLVYENQKLSDNKIIKSGSQAIKYCLDFLEDRNISTDDMKLSYISNEDNYILRFTKVYNDKYIEITNTEFIVNSYGIVRMERSWFDIIEESERKIYIDSAPKALLDLLNKPKIYGKSIIRIDKCYYLNQDAHEEFSQSLDTMQGKAIPTWRIQFSDGDKIVIDNY